MCLSRDSDLSNNYDMSRYRQQLKKEIIRKYGSVNVWSQTHNVPTERFYNFLKGTYNPTIKTLEAWLDSLALEISIKKK